jgi:predicted kinase
MFVLMAGLPGTGKSTLAQELARSVSGTVLDKDDVRRVLFGPRDLEYSTQQDDFVMEIMLQTAGYIFSKDANRTVFLDGRPFSRNSQIEHVKTFAASLSQPWRIVECVCSETSARDRLESQFPSAAHPAANRNFDLYLKVKAHFEPIPPPKTVIDTDSPLEACVNLALHALRS